MSYTNGLDDPSAYFQTATYTGNAGNQTITNDGNSDLQPDMVWIKSRTFTSVHLVQDSSRGASGGVYYYLQPDNTAAEAVQTDGDGITSLNSDGFSLGFGNSNSWNQSGNTYVGWQWKANGGTTASNTDGTITSTVQANQDAGFSIVTATSPGSNGHWSFGHGLGVKPDMVITKQRDGGGWWTWHKDLTNQTTYYLGLNQTNAETNEANMWGGGMTSSVIGVSSPNSTLVNKNYIAYCFAEKQGYSKFGKYEGSGDANGPFIYTGFKPAFIMVKTTALTDEWNMFDNRRSGFNVNNDALYASSAVAEDAGSVSGFMDIVSNGFKLRRAANSPNRDTSYIYMAFAEHPFVTSTGIPTTAR